MDWVITSVSFQDSSLLLANKLGNPDKIKEGIQGGINVNARDEACQLNYSNISVVYKSCIGNIIDNSQYVMYINQLIQWDNNFIGSYYETFITLM